MLGTKVQYRLKKGRSSKLRLSFDEQGVLQIQTPTGRIDEAMPFLTQKARWVLKHQNRLMGAAQQAIQHKKKLTEEVFLLGKKRRVEYLAERTTRYRLAGEMLTIFTPQKHLHRQQELLHFALRRLADTYLKRRTLELAEHTGSKLNAIRVKNHKSKWGSCSSNRNINLNWHLVLFDKAVIDYVIIHELMHLREMNHGPCFWAHVANYCPYYKDAIRILHAEQWKIGMLE